MGPPPPSVPVPPPAPAPGVPAPPPAPITPSPTCTMELDGTPQLKVTVADIDGAGTGTDVFGRILVGDSKKIKRAEWSNWVKLDHSGCTNLRTGTTDYFNEFANYTDPWIAIAVYNCGDDNVIVDKIGFWDGRDMEEIDFFCPGIGGPSQDCGKDVTYGDVGDCNKGFDGVPFNYYEVDQDTCKAMSFTTFEKTTAKVLAAKPYISEDPGIPACTTSQQNHHHVIAAHKLNVDDGLVIDESLSSSYMSIDNISHIGIPMVGLLSGAIAYTCYRRNKNKHGAYQKLSSTDYQSTV